MGASQVCVYVELVCSGSIRPHVRLSRWRDVRMRAAPTQLRGLLRRLSKIYPRLPVDRMSLERADALCKQNVMWMQIPARVEHVHCSTIRTGRF